MNGDDSDIKKAMGKADWVSDMDAERDETFRQMLAGTFRGRPRWMAILAWVYILAFTAMMVVAALQFFQTEATRDQILWATVFLASSFIVMFLKLWFWTVMNRNAVTREIKRLELRVAELGEQLAGK
ncbi:MAG: DUF6768 family protein [Planctomycetota bacterium]|jgi:hypothetical protein